MERTPVQLALLETPPAVDPAREVERKRRAASMTARACNALLAELDRVAQLDRAQHLANLFEAAERAHAAREAELANQARRRRAKAAAR